MKLYTIDWNPIGKNPFVGGQNPTIPSPIFSQFFTPVMHCQWEVPNTTVTMPVDRLWRVIAQRKLLGSCYAPTAEKCYNPISFSHKPKTEFPIMARRSTVTTAFCDDLNYRSVISASIDNAAVIQIIAKCSCYCC